MVVQCCICGQNVEIEDDNYELEFCCSGLAEQCGCGGFPINPVFCSECEIKANQ